MFFPSDTVAIVKKYSIFFFFQNKKRQPFAVSFCLERVMRIELTTTAWEAVVLPLNYTRTSKQTTLITIWLTPYCYYASLLLLFPKSSSILFGISSLFCKLRSQKYTFRCLPLSLRCFSSFLKFFCFAKLF